MEFYSRQQSKSYLYFLNKMNLLLTSSKVVQLLQENHPAPPADDPALQQNQSIYDAQLQQRQSLQDIPNNMKNELMKQSLLKDRIDRKSTQLVQEQLEHTTSLQLAKQQDIDNNREAILSRIKDRNRRNRNHSQKSHVLNTCPDELQDDFPPPRDTLVISSRHHTVLEEGGEDDVLSVQSQRDTVSPFRPRSKEHRHVVFNTTYKPPEDNLTQ